MPHVVIEYSANLEAEMEPMALVRGRASGSAGAARLRGARRRTRASRREHFLVADGDPENAFVAVTARIGPGRDAATRKAASEAIMAALYQALEPIYRRRGLALSVEVTELDAGGMTRRNNLRERAGAARSEA